MPESPAMRGSSINEVKNTGRVRFLRKSGMPAVFAWAAWGVMG